MRQVWAELPREELRQAVLTCELYAEGLATLEQLREAGQLARDAYHGIGDIVADHSALAVRELCYESASFPMGTGSSAGIAAVVAELRFDDQTPWHIAGRRARQFHCHLFRDIFGNPFRPVTFQPAWQTESVLLLARSIYANRAFDRMPILADALEEAGCDDPDVLTHCRTDGPHVRGCWVVDTVLGKE